MKSKCLLTNWARIQAGGVPPGAIRENAIQPGTAGAMMKILLEWKRILLALILTGISMTALTGCVVREDDHDRWHEHGFDHDHDWHEDHP